ncbi:MAG TPA: AAA family ATPase [Planctomycetota bacterium]
MTAETSRSRRLEIYVARGHDKINESEFEDAREYFTEALLLDPGCAAAFRGRGLAWQYLRETANALADYNEALRLNPEDAKTFLSRGTARQWKGDLEGAVADYTDAIRLDAKLLNAYRYRAGARVKLKDVEGALRDLDELLQAAPEDPRAYYARAGAWMEKGESGKALADLDEAVRLDPRMADAFDKRSAIHEERGDREKAKEDVDRARDIRMSRLDSRGPQKRTQINGLLQAHFHPVPPEDLTVTERLFPFRVRADLQRATQALFSGKTRIFHYSGVQQANTHEGLNFNGLIVPHEHYPPLAVPPEYEEIDIGEGAPVRCPKVALWLLQDDESKYAVLLCPQGSFGRVEGLKIQVAAPSTPEGTRLTQDFFKRLEDSVLRSESYRGKVLSLESRDTYSGQSSGLLVHKLKDVGREQVILPRKILELLDRNVLSFSRQREKLGSFGLSRKKGILLYGPPGNGKTHTIHYLSGALKGHTTFLITAGQMGLLSEYMTLARLLQPSLVVIEDVDLIARDRQSMNGPCEESLLNLLLNEMDGLRQDSDVFFIMTTNRPESLEAALASRPGRIDQAIEYPHPDEDCREKLLRLYSRGLSVSPELIGTTVNKTKGVSASFIRELMRRSAQFHLERGGSSGEISGEDIDAALQELVSGKFNRRLLGGADA